MKNTIFVSIAGYSNRAASKATLKAKSTAIRAIAKKHNVSIIPAYKDNGFIFGFILTAKTARREIYLLSDLLAEKLEYTNSIKVKFEKIGRYAFKDSANQVYFVARHLEIF